MVITADFDATKSSVNPGSNPGQAYFFCMHSLVFDAGWDCYVRWRWWVVRIKEPDDRQIELEIG